MWGAGSEGRRLAHTSREKGFADAPPVVVD